MILILIILLIALAWKFFGAEFVFGVVFFSLMIEVLVYLFSD